MFSKIMYVTVFVSDQDKALDFYMNSFGFQKHADYSGPEGRFVTIALKDQGFEVLLWRGSAGVANATPGVGALFIERGDEGLAREQIGPSTVLRNVLSLKCRFNRSPVEPSHLAALSLILFSRVNLLLSATCRSGGSEFRRRVAARVRSVHQSRAAVGPTCRPRGPRPGSLPSRRLPNACAAAEQPFS